MFGKFFIPLERIIFALSEALDCVNPQVVQHQLKVSYISRLLGRELGFRGPELEALVMAGALHDIGLFTLREKLLAFEEGLERMEEHTILGYKILREFGPLKRSAVFVLYHHSPWQEVKAEEDHATALGSNIIQLADKLEILSRPRRPLLSHVKGILEDIHRQKERFAPEVLEALEKIASHDLFWLRLEHFKKETEVVFQLDTYTHVSCEEMGALAALFAIVIDLRSPFTQIHSAGVVRVAEWLGSAREFSPHQLDFLRTAAYLHDLGKLAIPEEILNKPGPLSPEEWSLMKAHPFITYRILENIPHFETIMEWAGYHHERLDGRGYPAGLDRRRLSLGSRIIAVADVTTALLEDRPYRSRMAPEKAAGILKELAGKALDAELVRLVTDNLDYVVHLIEDARSSRYERFESWGRVPLALSGI